MKKTLSIIALGLICFNTIKAQTTTDSTAVEPVKGTWNLNLDLASRYIWRGQSWGGNYPVAQFYGTYNITNKLSVGLWASQNFKKEPFELNDFGLEYRGYQEIDFVANYQVNNYLTASLQWYYWPTTQKVEGVSNKLFDFGNTSVNTLDFMLMFNFTDKGLPLWLTWSTFLAGNDFRYKNEDDIKGTQNFTSYVEAGYTFDLPAKLSLSPVVGAVLNNKSGYYTYANTDKVAFVNLGAKLSREFKLSEKLAMPIWVSFTHNASDKEFSVPANTKDIKAHYVVFGTTFSLSK